MMELTLFKTQNIFFYEFYDKGLTLICYIVQAYLFKILGLFFGNKELGVVYSSFFIDFTLIFWYFFCLSILSSLCQIIIFPIFQLSQECLKILIADDSKLTVQQTDDITLKTI